MKNKRKNLIKQIQEKESEIAKLKAEIEVIDKRIMQFEIQIRKCLFELNGQESSEVLTKPMIGFPVEYFVEKYLKRKVKKKDETK